MSRFANMLSHAGVVLALGCYLPLALAQSYPIECSTTPFGKGNRLLQDDEFLTLFSNGDNSSSGFGEYRLPFAAETQPLSKVYDNALPELPLAAINVDLNGDGRDEVAVAYQSSNTLVVAVYARTDGFAPGYHLLRDWQYNAASIDFSQVHLIAGDFAGSADRKRELAVLWSGGPSDGRLHLVILTGAADGDGSITDADNSMSGEWHSSGNFFAPTVGLARGDFLLDGRDQIAVVSANGTNLYYDLLEFNNDTSGIVNSGLPIAAGDTAIGSKQFTSGVSSFADDAFSSANVSLAVCPAGNCTQRVSIFGSPAVYKIVASGGDMVDSAAAELVVHLSLFGTAQLVDAGGNSTNQSQTGVFLGQRLLHFATTQTTPGGDISDVELGSGGTGRDFDFSQIPGARNFLNGLPSPAVTTSAFDAAIGAADGQEKQSVALVHVVNGGQLEVDVYQASVRLNASFQFTVHAAAGPFPVDFTNTSTGDVANVNWDFGDGSSSVAVNSSHSYNATGNYTVTLTVIDSAGHSTSYGTTVQINGQASPAGGAAANYTYQMTMMPMYSAATQDQHLIPSIGTTETISSGFGNSSQPHISIGDMNRDGFAEIMTTAQSIVSDTTQAAGFPPSTNYRATIWRSLWRVNPTQNTFSGADMRQVVASSSFTSPPLPYSSASVLASDFDGDSIYATLSSDPGACRAVSEPQLRDLIWQPPYFAALQSGIRANGYIQASFGLDQRSGTGTENRSGSFTGNDVSGYIGIQAGTDDVAISPVNFKVSLKFTAGHDWQSSHGAIHGSDTEYDYSEGQAATLGEALVVAEADDANCYAYDVVQSTGAVPDSSMRMCEITYQERTAETADTWNDQVDYAQTSPNWVPVQRDWASLAMFRPATSTIPFSNGKGPENATDGLFRTPAASVTTTEPYLDIDLGKVQDIASIRVFPAANTDAGGNLIAPLAFDRAAVNLQGFRIYASATPFAGPDVPSSAGVTVYAPGTPPNDVVYDRWNILTLDSNFNLLRARYIRLQHPGQSPARINISQIEVFGATHSDPPAYPDAVCEPAANKGYFLARVWNLVAGGYQNIEERGDLMWSGTNPKQQPTGVMLPSGQPCLNHTDVRETTIWNNLRIGNAGIANSWNSTSDTTNTVGSYGGIESSTRVGAEFDTEIGNEFVQATAGAAYEFSFGISSDTQSTSFWGSGLEIGGSIGGFDPEFQNLVLPCGYFPHPYSYHLTERGNTSYQHDLYVVDYTVHQPGTSSAWQRGSVPLVCTGDEDKIFADGFGK